MDSTLVKKLNQHLSTFAEEITKLFESEDYRVGFFHDQNPSKVTYFNAEEYNLGMHKVENFAIPLFDISERYKDAKLEDILTPKLKELYSNISSSTISENFLPIDFSTDEKRSKLYNLCRDVSLLLDGIKHSIPIISIHFEKQIESFANIAYEDITPQMLIAIENCYWVHNHFFPIRDFAEIDSSYQQIKENAPYSLLGNTIDSETQKIKLDFEHKLFHLINSLKQAKEDLKNMRADSSVFLMLNHKLKLFQARNSDERIYLNTKIENDIVSMPINVKTEDQSVLINKINWVEFYLSFTTKIGDMKFINLGFQDRNTLFKKSDLKLDFEKHQIFRFIRMKLYTQYIHFEQSLISLRKTPVIKGKISDSKTLITILIQFYTNILKDDKQNIQISETLTLPKKLSDIYLKGLIDLLTNKLNSDFIEKEFEEFKNLEQQEDINELKLLFPYKKYWNEVKYGALTDVQRDLFSEDEERPYYLPVEHLIKINKAFFDAEKNAKEELSFEYLNLRLPVSCPKKAIGRFFFDLSRTFYPKDRLIYFCLILKLAYPEDFKDELSVAGLEQIEKRIKKYPKYVHNRPIPFNRTTGDKN